MVKHPLQNLEASLGPQPSGLNVGRTHTRLRLVQKTQFNVTHKHTEYGISAGDMHMDFICFLCHSRQPAKELSHFMYYKEQLSRANSNP